MLTLKECKELVDPKGENYTEVELNMMLELVNNLASIAVNQIKTESDDEKSRNNGESLK